MTHVFGIVAATAVIVLCTPLPFLPGFVMYNPRDLQTMTSHKADRLQLTPQQQAIEQGRGHYAVHDARHPHWKYFWFD
jgi:hypothetical protein